MRLQCNKLRPELLINSAQLLAGTNGLSSAITGGWEGLCPAIISNQIPAGIIKAAPLPFGMVLLNKCQRFVFTSVSTVKNL